jgi:hypothetical protein
MKNIKFKINDEVSYYGCSAIIKKISKDYKTALIICPLLFAIPYNVQIISLEDISKIIHK